MHKKIHFKNLDSLRAIAAIAVVLTHVSNWVPAVDNKFNTAFKFLTTFDNQGGELGVIFFFILSGFLITYLLFNEKQNTGEINILFFYYKRLLRIWPLYFLTIIIGFYIFPLFNDNHSETANILMYSLFLTNFDHIYFNNPSCGILGVQWSVAIEEQFYLVWPIIFLVLKKTKTFPIIFLLIIIISELFHFQNRADWSISYYHSFSAMRFLAWGGLLGHMTFYRLDSIKNFLTKIKKHHTVLIYTTCLSFLVFNNMLVQFNSIFNYLNVVIQFIFFGFVILEQIFSNNSFYKFGKITLLNKIGKISYGIYLYHMIAIYIVKYLLELLNIENYYIHLIIILSTVFLISHLSYKYFESIFMKLRTKFNLKLLNSHIF